MAACQLAPVQAAASRQPRSRVVVNLLSNTPAQIGGLAVKRHAAFSIVCFDDHEYVD